MFQSIRPVALLTLCCGGLLVVACRDAVDADEPAQAVPSFSIVGISEEEANPTLSVRFRSHDYDFAANVRVFVSAKGLVAYPCGRDASGVCIAEVYNRWKSLTQLDVTRYGGTFEIPITVPDDDYESNGTYTIPDPHEILGPFIFVAAQATYGTRTPGYERYPEGEDSDWVGLDLYTAGSTPAIEAYFIKNGEDYQLVTDTALNDAEQGWCRVKKGLPPSVDECLILGDGALTTPCCAE